jgi:hypothetical protein
MRSQLAAMGESHRALIAAAAAMQAEAMELRQQAAEAASISAAAQAGSALQHACVCFAGSCRSLQFALTA